MKTSNRKGKGKKKPHEIHEDDSNDDDEGDYGMVVKRRILANENEEGNEACASDKDTDHCFTCGAAYAEGEEKQWIGCDLCYRWYHFKCAGFKSLP